MIIDMIMIPTVGVESSHGHDIAADIDGGTPLPEGEQNRKQFY